MKKKNSFCLALSIFCLVLFYIVSVSIYREYKCYVFSQDNPLEFNKTLVTAWLDALNADDPQKALFLASKMVSHSSPYVPLPYYVDMTTQSGINSRFFNPPFTMLDYLYWKNEYNIRHIVNKVVSNINIPKHFFTLIFKDIELIKYNKDSQHSAFLFEIWKKKQSSILDKYLLFSEFMRQADYDVQIVALFSNIKKPPVHLIAEIRKDKEVYVCDFLTGHFWNKSIKELAEHKNLLNRIWKQEWIKGLDHLLFKTEISAMSYRKINQQLYKYLATDKNKNIPIIGIDPYEKMKEYRIKFYPNQTNSSKLSLILGIEPYTMIKNSNNFLKHWLINKS